MLSTNPLMWIPTRKIRKFTALVSIIIIVTLPGLEMIRQLALSPAEAVQATGLRYVQVSRLRRAGRGLRGGHVAASCWSDIATWKSSDEF